MNVRIKKEKIEKGFTEIPNIPKPPPATHDAR